ncbi:hypothetical protein NQ317_009858 [Molorchus minor]|uniref:Large ribosomal subunit protein mL46 N-terminal domain-containing protein n=1 Tax=Molorchus minor TaxID=1323400 RepID=A0ABQ9K2U5_9CUCU|nr:hypothetical protein NQ317_009858 [Molorchus minor]
MFSPSFRHLCNIKLVNVFKAQICTSTSREKWDLLSAVCIERKPIITPALNELEREYRQYLSEVEFEKSLKSDHEVRHEAEMRQLESLKKET